MRIHKKDRNFAVLDKTFIQDRHLSLKAKGMLCYLLALPHDWEIHLTELTRHFTDGIDAVKSTMRELIAVHYVQHVRHRDDKGIFTKGQYVVYETPQRQDRHEVHASSDDDQAIINDNLPLPNSVTDNRDMRSDYPAVGNPRMEKPLVDNPMPKQPRVAKPFVAKTKQNKSGRRRLAPSSSHTTVRAMSHTAV